MNAVLWTAVDIALARELWDEGLSCSAIGARFGRTKHSVVGLAHRRHWPPRASPISNPERLIVPRTPKRNRKAELSRAAHKPRTVTLAPIAAAPPLPTPPKPPAVAAVPLRTCAWLLGERPAWRPCSAPVVAGCSWCIEHRARAYAHGSRVAA
jgi:hypothetical protein